ncbi:acyltransferase [Vibrio tetraodonis]|uniref:acyltransferase n=1 Tax=Vibrio tetraodonis TaxID=2231647 RepID=UPI000E0ADC7D|nr:acyltransferase [Vibrio tetraodonis]
MSYYSRKELVGMGFKYLGRDVKVSRLAAIYDHQEIEIGDFSRIDDFCILSGKVSIGRFCHITPMCLLAGGHPGIQLKDFVTLAYGVKAFAQSDDYSGQSMTNSLIPKEYKQEKFAALLFEKHVIVGANSTVLPGVVLAEGCAIGAMTLISKSTKAWGIYTGIPGKRVKERYRNIQLLEKQFLQSRADD